MTVEPSPTNMRVTRPTTTLRELALAKMHDAILQLQFVPGERLVERRLCESLGVSRTVVREVLRHLEAEGLVETKAHHGPIIAMLDPKTVEQIYEVRGALEQIAARALAEKGDKVAVNRLSATLDKIAAAVEKDNLKRTLEQTTEFYETLFLSSGRSISCEIVRNLNARISLLRALTLSTGGRSRAGIEEMRAVVEAIAAGDAEAAEAACRIHTQNGYKIARSRLAEKMAEDSSRADGI